VVEELVALSGEPGSRPTTEEWANDERPKLNPQKGRE
jgi:hypothetical protein